MYYTTILPNHLKVKVEVFVSELFFRLTRRTLHLVQTNTHECLEILSFFITLTSHLVQNYDEVQMTLPDLKFQKQTPNEVQKSLRENNFSLREPETNTTSVHVLYITLYHAKSHRKEDKMKLKLLWFYPAVTIARKKSCYENTDSAHTKRFPKSHDVTQLSIVTSPSLVQSSRMEVVSKKRLTTKISKIDRDLKHLEQFLSEGIVKETLMAEMKNKKRPLNRKMNQELKKQKQKQEPKS